LLNEVNLLILFTIHGGEGVGSVKFLLFCVHLGRLRFVAIENIDLIHIFDYWED